MTGIADSSTATFMLFGMGPTRRKLLYVPGGRLLDALTFEPIRVWEAEHEELEPHEYRVVLRTRKGQEAVVSEDEDGVWLDDDGRRECLTRGQSVRLPRFGAKMHAPWLRALHAELLVNVMPVGPVPNLWVYPRPWYRDAAMMLMCLQRTGNLGMVEPWVMGLRKVWDRNNRGREEPDNLGQVLYMLSLVEAGTHPLIDDVLKAIPDCRRDRHVVGITDGRERPVYQTKWLKYGLKALGLDDTFEIPEVVDSYSSLFWMDYRDQHVPGERFGQHQMESYPYLNWAEAHFYREPFPEPLVDLHSPLTLEAKASQAEYWRLQPLAGLGAIPSRHAANRVAMPHTWHAAEMFLYLIESDD